MEEVSIKNYYDRKDISEKEKGIHKNMEYAIRTLEIELAKVEDSIRTFNRYAVYPEYVTDFIEGVQSRLFKEKSDLEKALKILKNKE